MKTSKISFFLALALAWVGHFSVDMMIGIWPVYKTLFHVDLAIAGLIGALCAFLGEGLQIFFGSLSDKGYRKTLILCGVVATCASACFPYVSGYFSLFLLYLLTCAGSGAFHPSAVSLVGELSESRKGMLMALFTSGGALGMAISQIAFTQTHLWFDGHASLLALPAILLVFLAALTPIARQKAVKASTPHFDLKVFVRFFNKRPLRLLYVSQVCNAIMLWGIMFLLPDLLMSRHYESWISFGGGHMAFILGGAVMMVPGGFLADRYSSRVVILVATVLGVLLFYLLLFIPFLSNIALLALLFSLGATVGTVNPIVVSLGACFVPDQKGAVGAFLMGLAWVVSETIAQGGGGFLATCFESDGPAKALAILGVFFVVGFITAYQLPKKEEALSFEPV